MASRTATESLMMLGRQLMPDTRSARPFFARESRLRLGRPQFARRPHHEMLIPPPQEHPR